MINTIELRIGNVVNAPIWKYSPNGPVIDRYEPYIVDSLNNDGIGLYGYNTTDEEGGMDVNHKSEDIVGIPITIEWLKENNLFCEHEPSPNANGKVFSLKNKLFYIIDGVANDHGDWVIIEREVQFIHELQNLNFALEKTELKLK